MHFLVTGAAGFIGFHTASHLLNAGHRVTGLDNINDYYDPALKLDRLKELETRGDFHFIKHDLTDFSGTVAILTEGKPDRVIHLAAQAGVRNSIEKPQDYIDANITGFLNVLEGCKAAQSQHLVYASSSSIYGSNTTVPFSTKHTTDHPISMYAVTKKANEMMAHCYSSLFGLPTTGLRFFTVYGPWGRPDMALSKFTRAILAGEPITLFNKGQHQRDFTYVDDIVEGIVRAAQAIPLANRQWDSACPEPDSSSAPFRIYNIGNNKPVELLKYIVTLEMALGVKAIRLELPGQPGEVLNTWADCSELQRDIGYAPKTSIETGIVRFVDWYKTYHGICDD